MRRFSRRESIGAALLVGLMFLCGCAKEAEQDTKQTTPEKQDQAIRDNPAMSPEAKAEALRERENGRANAEAMKHNAPPPK